MASEDLENDLYKNWVRGAKGLEYLHEGLQEFVGEKVLQCRNQTLQQIIQNLSTGSPHHCSQCTSQNLLPKHANEKNACNRSTCIQQSSSNCFGSKPKGRRICPNGICGDLYDAIVRDHSSSDPLWKNTDPSTWCSDPLGWSFGKCFQTTIGPGTSAKTTDATGLVSILINNLTIQNTWLACNDMSSKITCPFNRARDIRNAILHSPRLELDNQALGDCLDTFMTALQDSKCLINYEGSKHAVDKLLKLKSSQIDMSQNDETILLKIRKDALSELDEKTAEALREIDDKAAAAVLTLKEDVDERASAALCDLKEEGTKVKLDVQKKRHAALTDLERKRKRAKMDIDQRKEKCLSEIEVAKRNVILQMENQQTMAVTSGESEFPSSLQSVPTSSVLSDLKEDLKVLYMQQYHTLPLSPLIEEQDTPLLTFYVMPDINSVEIQRSLGGGSETRSKITSLLDVFHNKSKKSREIYLTADAGFGKTAFSKRLVLTWCQAHNCTENEHKYFKAEDIRAMSEFEFVFMLSLRDCSQECDIDEMIMKQIIPRLANTSISLRNLETILSNGKCLVILDGLDEWTHPASACKQGPSDIPHRKARECTIITTTRPWKLSVINIKLSQTERKLELVGLNKTSAEGLKRNVISILSGETDVGKHLQEFDSAVAVRGISDLETIPILLMYLLCLWCDEIDLGNSKCELYCQIVELLLSRTFSKNPKMQKTYEPPQSEIPQCFSEYVHCKKYYTLLTSLGQLAFETLFSKIRENSLVFDSRIANKYLTQDYLELSFISGILTQSKVHRKLIKHCSKVSFSHKTVQEYFSALYISCQNKSDIQKIILQNCSTIQNILDMSTVFVFISGINAEIISSISRELMSLISKDKITIEHRSMARFDFKYVNPLKDIQNMYIACIKENPNNDSLKLCLQDFIINEDFKGKDHYTHSQRLAMQNKKNIESIFIVNEGISSLHDIIDSFALYGLGNIKKIHYKGECTEADIGRMLSGSVKCLTLISCEWQNNHFVPKPCSWSNDLSKTFQNISLLQAIYIDCFSMSHDILEGCLNYIISRNSMKEIKLYNLSCSEHDTSCAGINLDLSRHSCLSAIGLYNIPLSQLNVNVSSLEDCRVGPLSKPGLLSSYLSDITAASKLQIFTCSNLESSDDIETMLQTLPLLVQVKDIWLWGINLGERLLSLTPEMVNIKRVQLYKVTMSGSSLRGLVEVVEKIPQSVAVVMYGCNIIPEKEFEDIKTYIQTLERLTITYDGTNKFYRHAFKFQTIEVESRVQVSQ